VVTDGALAREVPPSDFKALAASLSERPSPARVREEFTPPPRFRDKSFANYQPGHETQAMAVARVERAVARLAERSTRRRWWIPGPRAAPAPSGLYLDGGFGVGKTHLLAAMWNAAPGPKAYLSFDELMYFIGLTGTAAAVREFAGYRLITIDEWELDDPGNLKLALAFLRGVIGSDVFVAVTSNTLPLELGAGRFSQKDFRSEIEELSGAFEVVTVQGEDYRHRHFLAGGDAALAWTGDAIEARIAASTRRWIRADFTGVIQSLACLHPIRYREIAKGLEALCVVGITAIPELPDALRWVHFIDSVYDAGVEFAATGDVSRGSMFSDAAMRGPYGKKLSRCLSRMEELIGDPG
jgi:cell division protein ZapE